MQNAIDYANNNKNTFRQQLHELLKIPSISTDPQHKSAMDDATEWLVTEMKRVGLENVEIMPTAGHPSIYGDWLHAGDSAPTILVYGHYDVQPAVIEDGWTNDPFEPIERDGKIYARGASDDKGQAYIHIKVVESILQAEGKLPVNIKFLIEGEEEIGSPNLPALIKDHAQKLSADVCLISDTGMNDINQPLIVNGLRGLLALELEVHGPKNDMHSGATGGAVHNPLQALAEIIAKLHDDSGRVTVNGFYDDVYTLTDADRKEMAMTDVTPKEWKEHTGIPAVWGEPEYSIRERIGARPTLEINGLIGGFIGEGTKTVMPAKAMAKITCRLVPNQEPEKILTQIKDYVAEITPNTVKSEIRQVSGIGYPILIKTDSSAMQAAIRAYEKGWGATPIFIRGGGTLPILPDFQRELNDLPIILMGYGLTTDGAHGPDESLTIEMFHRGITTAIHFLYEVAQEYNT